MKKEINYKKIAKWLAVIACIVVVVLVISYAYPTVLADVGNNNRYENNSSSSSGDDGWIWFFIHLLFDLLGFWGAAILIAILAVIYFILKKTGKLHIITDKFKKTKQNVAVGATPSIDNTVAVGEAIRLIDPAFSQDAFIGWVREVFIKIQQAWSSRDWRVIRPFESNELFTQHTAQLQEFINNNKINMIEKIAIQSCTLREFRQEGDKEVIVVELQAVMRDYVIDATTRAVLESDPNKDWHMRYLMTFNRKAGIKTNPGTSNKSTTNCPNCGAPTQITSSGQCEYCSSVITTGEHDWVLSDIRSIQ